MREPHLKNKYDKGSPERIKLLVSDDHESSV